MAPAPPPESILHQQQHLFGMLGLYALWVAVRALGESVQDGQHGEINAMSGFLTNRFTDRRGFVSRALAGAASFGAVTLFASNKSQEANPFAYNVGQYIRTDPKLIAYEQKQVLRIPHAGARGIIMNGDGQLVVGAGKHVNTLKSDGTPVFELELSEECRCLAAAGNELYVGFRTHVEVYARAGQRKAAWGSLGSRAYLTGVAVGENDLFIADAGQRVLLRYDRSGKLLKRIGEKNAERNIPGFIVPSPFFAVTLAKDGLLRVTNPGRHRVEIYTADGDFELAWGKPGAAIENFCGCCNPIHLAMLNDGRSVTLEKGIPRVKVYAADGTFESVVAGAESFSENAKVCGPHDCTVGGLAGAVDTEGRIYILDFVANNIRVMERKA
jgi:hypothetical protein